MIMYLIILALLGLGAFFSCSETAISTVNRLRLRKNADDGDSRAKTALRLAEDYDRTLFTVLICNNIVTIVISALATMVATAQWGTGGVVIASAVVTVMVIVFADIIPKSYAGHNSDRLALSVAKPLNLVAIICAPLIWLLKRIPTGAKDEQQLPTVTEDELIYMLDTIEEQGVLEEQERDLVQSALEFDEVTIGEIITPRVDLAALDIEAEPDEIRELLVREGYSRIPVYEDTIDNIIGVLLTYDYLCKLISGETPNLREMLAAPMFVHRTMKLSELLSKLRASKIHMAVVTDDYGGTLGIVTMEDLLEELVGEIWDEGDDATPGIVRVGVSAWEAEGLMSADDMFDILGDEKREYGIPDAEYNTVNGWAGHIFGHLPEEGERAVYKDLELTVLKTEGHRIQYLRIQKGQLTVDN